MTAINVGDTGLLAAIGQPSNPRYRALEQFARREAITFVLLERVYDELTEQRSAMNAPPVDTAIDEGWGRVADPLESSRPLVSRTMDGVQRYIANADDRPVDEVERTDAALAGVIAQALATEAAARAYVYTTDVAAGRAIETVFESEGYGDAITFVDGFRFVENLLE